MRVKRTDPINSIILSLTLQKYNSGEYISKLRVVPLKYL